MFRLLKKIIYKLLFIVLILFAVNTYINYKVKKAQKVADVKENIFEGGFFN